MFSKHHIRFHIFSPTHLYGNEFHFWSEIILYICHFAVFYFINNNDNKIIIFLKNAKSEVYLMLHSTIVKSQRIIMLSLCLKIMVLNHHEQNICLEVLFPILTHTPSVFLKPWLSVSRYSPAFYSVLLHSLTEPRSEPDLIAAIQRKSSQTPLLSQACNLAAYVNVK